MKHAGAAALDQLEELLTELRARSWLKEKTRGVFYHGGKAWLHFHDDPSGLYADIRQGDAWGRFRVSDPAEWQRLLACIDARPVP